jgi:hypothetical protein
VEAVRRKWCIGDKDHPNSVRQLVLLRRQQKQRSDAVVVFVVVRVVVETGRGRRREWRRHGEVIRGVVVHEVEEEEVGTAVLGRALPIQTGVEGGGGGGSLFFGE